MNKKKLLLRILNNQRNVSFDDFVSLIEAFGFTLKRVSGSHHVYKRDGVNDLVNIQNIKGMAKPYQIKQFLTTIERYNLHLREE